MNVNETSHGDDWDSHWDRYAATASLNPAQRMRHRAILAALRTRPWPLQRLLDVGSGQGDFLTLAAAAGAAGTYAGFELSESGVRISREKLPAAEFAQVDLFSPSAASKKFAGWASAAVCSDVIEHVDDPIGFLRELKTYLETGALLVLTVPGGPMSAFDRHIGHRRHYTRALVTDVLTQAGFTVDHVRLIGFPFFNLYRLMVILRGKQLIEDVEAENPQAAGGLARFVMAVFDKLFALNLPTFPLGWQVVALARKAQP
jgi:SAM-dependent methyltransferase